MVALGECPPGTVCSDASFDVLGVPVVPGTNTLTATNASTIVLGDTSFTHDANGPQGPPGDH